MTSPRLRQLDRQLAAVLAPLLERQGFQRDRRTFRRAVGAHRVQLVEVQVGVRSLAGQFTVNLAVFDPRAWQPPETVLTAQEVAAPREYHCHPDLRQRLGLLLPPPPQGLLGRLLRRPPPQPQDVWWPQSEDAAQMRATLEYAGELLLRLGLPWLEASSTEEAFTRAAAALEERKAALKAFRAAQGLPPP
ncbi:MAG TPA: DUF4304 domain-containing protein [Aggregicoccus sp.]|nr:DUF4304 domain-containing protein [Aggregicoccus sp.]